jgi:hypothetical protein
MVAALSVIIVLVGVLVGMGVSWGSLVSSVSGHHSDCNVHHTLGQLDDRYLQKEDFEKAITRLENAVNELERAARSR